MGRELLDYEIKIDPDANDRYGAFKVGSHDDLVTALGLAVQVEPPALVYGMPFQELRAPGGDGFGGRDPFIGGGFGLGGRRRLD